MSLVETVETVVSRYWAHRGPAPTMAAAHRHDDVEINVVLSGALDYRYGGTPITVSAGEVALFWGWTPHQLVGDRTGTGEMLWVHIPLADVLGWGLPDRALRAMLAHRPTIVPVVDIGRDIVGMLSAWQHDIADEDAGIIVNLEAHALVRRLLRLRIDDDGPLGAAPAADSGQRVIDMVRFVIEHFREPLTVADVAAVAHLHPGYAMTVFRREVGMTIGEYLTRCRIAEAQRLLAATPMPTADVATAAGFGSQSSFYAHFVRSCGLAPAAYRRSATA